MSRLPAHGIRLEIDASEPTLPTSIRSEAIATFVVLFAALAGLLAWSATAPIASGAVAKGRVMPDSGRKTITHLEGGIVRRILVHDGDFVKSGQTLIMLDKSQMQLTRSLFRDRWDQDRAFIARLEAERDGRDEIAFPSDLVERAAAEPSVADLLTAQRHQFTVRRANEQGKADILRQKAEELRAHIGGVEAQNDSRSKQLELLQEELKDVSGLHAKGLIPKPRLLELQRSKEDIRSSIAAAESQIASDRISIGESEMQILSDRKEFDQEVGEQLRQVTADRQDAQDRMAAIDDQLRRLTVQSPIDGQVMGLTVHTVGGAISPKERLMYVAPGGDRLVIDAEIPPTEIEHMRAGLPAEVRLPALRQRTTPTLMGSVASVSTDVAEDADQRQDFYNARIEIPVAELDKLGGQKLVAGMPVEVLIKTGERTALNYLVAPIKDAIFRSFRQD